MTAPAVQPPPRERAPAQYQELNEQRYRQQVDEELAQKHDKRSNLRLGRGKSLILSAPGGLEFALALDNDGFITVTNYSTGDVGELTVRFDNVEGLAQEFIDVRAEFAAADGSLSSAYIAADAVVAADAASANASLSTTLTAAFTAADATVASNAAALVTSEASTRAAADTAIASDVTALTARVTTAEGDINTVEATAAAIDGRLVTVEGSYATASSVSSLTATVNTKARTFSQTSAPTATATGDLWIDTDDNNRLYRWSGSAWVEITDPRIASSASTLTTVTADITTLETAVADLDATKAEASALTSLTATVTTVQSDLDTVESTRARTFAQTSAPTATTTGDLWIDTDDNNKLYRWSGSAWVAVDDARIATNAAAITTESSARASGDSANATLITSLTARVQKTTAALLPQYCAYQDDFTFVRPGDPATIASATGSFSASVVSDADMGPSLRLALTTAGNNLLTKGVLPIVAGRIYQVRIRFKVSTLPADGTARFRPVAVGLDASYANVASNFFTTSPGSFIDVSDTGVKELIGTIGDSTTVAQAAWPGSGSIQIRMGIRLDATEACTIDVQSIEFTDITDREALEASVTVNASAVADIEGRLAASYAIQVDGGGNGALISLEDGTEAPSAITLTADQITLDGDVIVTGSLSTSRLEANAVSKVTSVYWVTSGSNSLAVTTSGGALLINAALKAIVASDDANGTQALRIKRGTTTIYEIDPMNICIGTSDTLQAFSTLIIDTPSAGTYTYSVEVDVSGSNISRNEVSNFALAITELKR